MQNTRWISASTLSNSEHYVRLSRTSHPAQHILASAWLPFTTQRKPFCAFSNSSHAWCVFMELCSLVQSDDFCSVSWSCVYHVSREQQFLVFHFSDHSFLDILLIYRFRPLFLVVCFFLGFMTRLKLSYYLLKFLSSVISVHAFSQKACRKLACAASVVPVWNWL